MPKRLSRRAFIRAAAAAGAVTSVLGCEQNAQSVEPQSSQGAQSASAAISTPPSWKAHDPNDTDLQAFYGDVEIDVCSWGQGCLRLHKHFSKTQVANISGPQAGDLGNDATELTFAASLIDSMTVNTRYVRDHIRHYEPISDQGPWPDPQSIPGNPPDADLLHGIRRWIEIESNLFAGILSVYPKPINETNDPFGPNDDVAKRPFFHDELYRLAYNVPVFIDAENKNHWPDPAKQIHHVQAPAPPAPNSVPSSGKKKALGDLELAFHKLVQVHMEIASFMPAHLHIAAMARAGGARVALK